MNRIIEEQANNPDLRDARQRYEEEQRAAELAYYAEQRWAIRNQWRTHHERMVRLHEQLTEEHRAQLVKLAV